MNTLTISTFTTNIRINLLVLLLLLSSSLAAQTIQNSEQIKEEQKVEQGEQKVEPREQLTEDQNEKKGEQKKARREAVKQHIRTHLRPYGFVRNYFTFDTRESLAGTGDLFSYLPLDNKWNQTETEAQASGIQREDLKAQSSFRFLSLTTRLGLDIVGYQVGSTQFSGKVEADFYTGLSGVTGVALLRLRHAYMTLTWDSLSMGKSGNIARVDLLMGQTWHPMALDLPPTLCLNSGAPFGPFSRTPQVKLDARLAGWFSLTAAAMWQMQYTSAGPDGSSANYIKYSKTPEVFIGLNFNHQDALLVKAGVDILSISPRHIGTLVSPSGTEVQVRVRERLTTFTPFLYFQYKAGDFMLQAKSVFAESGEHVNLNGGYAVSRQNADGSRSYTPTRNSTTLVCLSYGKRIKGVLFAGYVRNFGTKESIISATDFYFSKNSFSNLNRAYRVAPNIVWTIGRFQLGAEYELTSAQYGDKTQLNLANGLAEADLHWVTNHRVQVMTKFNF